MVAELLISRLIRFIVLETLRFLYNGVLAWYCLFRTNFAGFRDTFLSNDVTRRPYPQKDASLLPPDAETRMSHKACKSVQRFDLLAWLRKKEQDRTVKKVTNISHIRGEAPTVLNKMKTCMVSNLPDIFTYAKFHIKFFRGYHFTGSNFPFSYWFCEGHTTVQRWHNYVIRGKFVKSLKLVKDRFGIT